MSWILPVHRRGGREEDARLAAITENIRRKLGEWAATIIENGPVVSDLKRRRHRAAARNGKCDE